MRSALLYWLGASLFALPQLVPAAETTQAHSKKKGDPLTIEYAPPQPRPLQHNDLPRPFRKATPTSLADLLLMEQHIKSLTARLSPAVVSVRVGYGSGSAVVISEDGLVVSVAHVSGEPNRDVIFTFPDGKTAKGKTLGTDHERDSSLMKITDKGKWPHADLGILDEARPGDWVLAMGHPGGFDPQRPTVVRLGRIISLDAAMVQTDCTLMSGDSGGPLFDMQGRVIAVHSRISEATEDNYHVPIRTYHETWDRLAKGENWGAQRTSPRPYVGAGGTDRPDGCVLKSVDENGPAARAGLKVGDIVLKINGAKITDLAAFRAHVTNATPGEEWTVQIKRDDNEMTVTLTVATRRPRS